MITPRKHLGQNFLRDPNTARRIVAALPAAADAPVVEIGAGTGALTSLLSERFASLIALEVDPRAIDVLRQTLPNTDVREADVLATDWSALAREMGGPIHVIGNLPYYITSQILFGLLDAGDAVAEAVVMMQREVAQRIVARPRTKAYGILSVVLQQMTRPKLLFHVSRNVFHPKPDVTSSVVHFDFRVAHDASVDPAWFRTVVRTAFNQRRKTLRNSLSRLCAELPDPWAAQRAEELSPDEFVDLARYLAAPTETGQD